MITYDPATGVISCDPIKPKNTILPSGIYTCYVASVDIKTLAYGKHTGKPAIQLRLTVLRDDPIKGSLEGTIYDTCPLVDTMEWRWHTIKSCFGLEGEEVQFQDIAKRFGGAVLVGRDEYTDKTGARREKNVIKRYYEYDEGLDAYRKSIILTPEQKEAIDRENREAACMDSSELPDDLNFDEKE